MAAMVGRSWDVFQPLLFGLIGAEIVVANLNPVTVGKNQNFARCAVIVSSVLVTVFHLQEGYMEVLHMSLVHCDWTN